MCQILFNLTLQAYKSKLLEKRYLTNLVQSFTNLKTKRYMTMDLKGISQFFRGTEDRYKGITVDSTIEHCKSEDFSAKLEESLKLWNENKNRGIWFKVALEHSEWVPILAKKGFKFHHAKEGYVMMYNWLPIESCNIPNYAHTMLAVGAIVVNEQSEILVVREKYFLSAHWKLPGGLVEPGENLADAAVREVKEETNIDGQFTSLVSVRHAHKGAFDCSDMYVVVSLKALSVQISKCPREIMDCVWMKVDEFLKHEEVTELNKLFVQRYLEYERGKMKIECREGIHQIMMKPYCVYSVVRDES